MIDNYVITNHLGESTTFELRFPEKSGFLIRSVDGLSPIKADINTTEVIVSDGAVFNSARIGSRNIVFSIEFLENPTIEDSRQKLYKVFPIKKRVKIRVKTTNRVGIIYGYVEANDVDLFSKNETAKISIICPDPYFYSEESAVVLFNGIEPYFEFPFSNESLSENLIEMSRISLNPIQNVSYFGDAPVGIVIYMHAIGVVENITITNLVTQETMTLDSDKIGAIVGSGIIAGDDIIISTIKGNKVIILVRAGQTFNIFNSLGTEFDWFHLENGDNLFSYSAEVGETNLQFRIEHQIAYEGM